MFRSKIPSREAFNDCMFRSFSPFASSPLCFHFSILPVGICALVSSGCHFHPSSHSQQLSVPSVGFDLLPPCFFADSVQLCLFIHLQVDFFPSTTYLLTSDLRLPLVMEAELINRFTGHRGAPEAVSHASILFDS